MPKNFLLAPNFLSSFLMIVFRMKLLLPVYQNSQIGSSSGQPGPLSLQRLVHSCPVIAGDGSTLKHFLI